MPVFIVQFTLTYFWSFALLGLGLAQNVSNKIPLEDINASTNGSLTMPAPISPSMPPWVRPRRASSDAALSCQAPQQPANGEWKLDWYSCGNILNCKVSEGTSLEVGSQLIYNCTPGFKVDGNTDVYCRGRGKWSPIPKCVEVKCASLNSVSTTVSCTRFGVWVSCDSPVPPHTRAEVSCRRGYKKDTEFITSRRAVINCKANGKWDPEPIRCVSICGQAITHQQPFISGGTPAYLGDFPWHATLYLEMNSQRGKEKVFICGATLIHSNLLLTAAHCVWDETYKKKQDPKKLFVATGNIFRDYDSPLHNPEIVRKAAVKNVYTYCQYYGLSGNYGSDIALLELHTPFEFSSILMPACLDDSEYRDQFLEPGIYGKVAGFGRTATGESSGNLVTLTIPYISYSQCKTSSNAALNEAFISNDKFCAGYTNGSAVCEGDSGGGLVFRKGDLWYVMGIVSVGLGVDTTSGERTCDKKSYSLYTKVSQYLAWIQNVLIYVERNQTYLDACSNGFPTTGTSTEILPLNAASDCLAPPQPENGEWKLHKDFCEGNTDCIVSEGTVLQPGSHLVYSCIPKFKIEGTSEVHCRLDGTWTAIPTCTGNACSTKNGSPGVCTLLKRCEPVLQGLKSGYGPENTCGFSEIQPIVCCPTSTFISPTTSMSPPGVKEISSDTRGAISRLKCLDYSRSVNASVCVPSLPYDKQPVTSTSTIGKVKARPMEFPHMAAVGFNLADGTISWLCGGTLISDSFVLTTAVCSNDFKQEWVRLGELNLKRSDDGAIPLDRRVIERILHPERKSPSLYHDIALLRLESPVSFNDWIRPACIHTAPSTDSTEAIATGWGAVDWVYDDEASDDLMKVTVPFVDADICNEIYIHTFGKIDDNLSKGIVGEWMICAGKHGKDTCRGDNGGPLVIHSEKQQCMYDLIGITSFGGPCGVGIPGIYTRVYHYIPWIESVVWTRG